MTKVAEKSSGQVARKSWGSGFQPGSHLFLLQLGSVQLLGAKKVACELHACSPGWQIDNRVIDGSSVFVIYLPCFSPSPNRADKEGFARESCIPSFSFFFFFPLALGMQFSLCQPLFKGKPFCILEHLNWVLVVHSAEASQWWGAVLCSTRPSE